MSLGDELYQILGESSSYVEEEDFELVDALDELREEGQSTAAFARELGVPRTTLRRWLAGGKPRINVTPIVNVARSIRRVRVLDERETSLRAGWPRSLFGRVKVSKRSSARTVSAQQLQLNHQVGDRLVTAFLNGAGPNRLGMIFVRSVGDDWYRGALLGRAGTFFDVDNVDGWG